MAYYEIQHSNQHLWDKEVRWGLIQRFRTLGEAVEATRRILNPNIDGPRDATRYRVAEHKGTCDELGHVVGAKGKLVALYDHQGTKVVAPLVAIPKRRPPKRIAA